MKKKFIISFCVIALSGLMTSANAQQQGSLRVLVLFGRTGNPLIGANVQLLSTDKRANAEILFGAATNGNGLVQFDDVQPNIASK